MQYHKTKIRSNAVVPTSDESDTDEDVKTTRQAVKLRG